MWGRDTRSNCGSRRSRPLCLSFLFFICYFNAVTILICQNHSVSPPQIKHRRYRPIVSRFNVSHPIPFVLFDSLNNHTADLLRSQRLTLHIVPVLPRCHQTHHVLGEDDDSHHVVGFVHVGTYTDIVKTRIEQSVPPLSGGQPIVNQQPLHNLLPRHPSQFDNFADPPLRHHKFLGSLRQRHMALMSFGRHQIVLCQSFGLLIGNHVQAETPLQFSLCGLAMVELIDEIAEGMLTLAGFDFLSEYFVVVQIEVRTETSSCVVWVGTDLVESNESVVDDPIAVHRYVVILLQIYRDNDGIGITKMMEWAKVKMLQKLLQQILFPLYLFISYPIISTQPIFLFVDQIRNRSHNNISTTMKYLALAVTALVATLVVLNMPTPDQKLTQEPVEPIFADLAARRIDYLNYNAAQCTKTLEVECAVDIEKTVVACSKAFETGGADIIADIKCTKDLLSDKKHCWPCICAEAKKKGWHIVGC